MNGGAPRFYWHVNPFKWKCEREELRDYQLAMLKCKKYECAGDQTSRGGGGEAMCVQHDIEARSRNCYCHGKAASIKYYECVYLIAAFFCTVVYCNTWPV